MVGYNPNEEPTPLFVTSLAGGASGVFTRALTQPLDVIKIRMQVQDSPWQLSKYRGTLNSMRKVAIEEGVTALWKGHVPAQALSLLYGLFQFTVFDMLTYATHPILSVSTFLQPLQDFFCGSCASVVATVFSYPFDVCRTRLIIQGHPPVYKSMGQTMKLIIQKESLGGLFRGLVPTLIQIAPNTGFQFSFYHMTSHFWDYTVQRIDFAQYEKSSQSTSVVKSLVCGSLAGLAAKSLVYPLDFTKKRLQAEGVHSYSSTVVGKAQNYKGFVHCAITVMKKEGLLAVYKGFIPSSIKALSTSALIFSSYENFKQLFSKIHKTTY